jgi:hypothetical protein
VWLLATSAALPAETPEIAITQPGDADGVPRPAIGVASPDATALTFHVGLIHGCPADTERRRLFVSIADTWRLEDATKTPSPTVMRIDVPVRQMPWLVQSQAQCQGARATSVPDEVTDAGIRYFRLRGEVTGYATLTCTGKDRRSAAATSVTTLDVWLSCPAAVRDEAPGAGRGAAPPEGNPVSESDPE